MLKSGYHCVCWLFSNNVEDSDLDFWIIYMNFVTHYYAIKIFVFGTVVTSLLIAAHSILVTLF